MPNAAPSIGLVERLLHLKKLPPLAALSLGAGISVAGEQGDRLIHAGRCVVLEGRRLHECLSLLEP